MLSVDILAFLWDVYMRMCVCVCVCVYVCTCITYIYGV